ncbi:MAG TPA: hypothetical protein VJN44_19285, partial [Roseateles sp.]|nr:hypothetical protein [Roseateles sp.]
MAMRARRIILTVLLLAAALLAATLGLAGHVLSRPVLGAVGAPPPGLAATPIRLRTAEGRPVGG